VDVAAELGDAWVLDGERGLLRLDPDTGRMLGDPISIQGYSGQGDVYAGAGAIWVGDRGASSLVRIDPQDGRLLGTVQLQGNYLDLAFDGNAVWALSRTNGTDANLTALDLSSGRAIGSPLPIKGGAVEVATGAGSVWVALKDEAAVLKIDPVAFMNARTQETPPN
jgi:streptogramin lyase